MKKEGTGPKPRRTSTSSQADASQASWAGGSSQLLSPGPVGSDLSVGEQKGASGRGRVVKLNVATDDSETRRPKYCQVPPFVNGKWMG